MRIGIITGEYPPMEGGVGAYTHILAENLTRQDQEVFIFTSKNAGRINPAIPVTGQIDSWNPWSVRLIPDWARLHQLSIINIQFQTAAFKMSPWIHFLPHFIRRIPVVTTFHDLRFPYLFPKAGKLRDWFVNHLANISDGVIVTNHEDYAHIPHHSKILIPIGSNIPTNLPDDFNQQRWRRNAGAGDNEFLLAYFGFVNHSKGIDILLESLAILRDQDMSVKLLMIGGQTGSSDASNIAYMDEIIEKIESLSLTSAIIWTGFVDDQEVSACLKASDLVVLPYRDGASYRRGSLMAAIENECAIITTEPAIEIPAFIHRRNMLFAPPDNPPALAKSIKQGLESRELREKLRKGARELKHHFDWSIIARDYIAFFQHLNASV